MNQQLELMASMRQDLNAKYLYFTDTCVKIFDVLVDSCSETEELLQIMEDGISLKKALEGTRLESMLSAATPLQWAYVASVFREVAHNQKTRHCAA